MKDGLWAVIMPTWVAGFIIIDGKVWDCAPILRNRFDYWAKRARWIGGC